MGGYSRSQKFGSFLFPLVIFPFGEEFQRCRDLAGPRKVVIVDEIRLFPVGKAIEERLLPSDGNGLILFGYVDYVEFSINDGAML